ncbi:MAG: YiiX family permuted papain-like enzyme [Zoogloeaceae bacterium]|nr:YiiX family permuted papain-like enzyme [Zoogloeaceae bacterium]
MRSIILIFIAAVLAAACTSGGASTPLQDGDLIFQISRSSQSQAIQLATKSKYSHVGILFAQGGKWYVHEAARFVEVTPLQEWIARGEAGHYVVKRLKNAGTVLTPEVLARMQAESRRFAGKAYDLAFGWSDEKFYCSELVWKIYQRGAGVEVGKLQKLGEFDLSHAAVKAKLRERYGQHIPLNETVISPAAIFASEQLETVE